jgi:hypothetical protein
MSNVASAGDCGALAIQRFRFALAGCAPSGDDAIADLEIAEVLAGPP